MTKVDYSVVFSERHGIAHAEQTISLSPRERRWNDFGFNFNASMEIVPPAGRDRSQLDCYVIPIDQNSVPVNFADWVDANWKARREPFKAKKSGFFSLLSSDDAYKKLFNWCSNGDEYTNILYSINDLTWVIDNHGADERIVRGVINSDAFRLGVIRTGGAYRAFKSGYVEGARYLLELSDARLPWKYSTQLLGFQGRHELKIDYVDTTLLEDRVHCLVGANGVGKSRLLRELLLSIAKGVDDDNPFPDVFNEEYKKSSLADMPKFARVIAYSTEIDTLLPEFVRSDSQFDYQHCSLTSSLHEQGSASVVKMSKMLIDLLRGSESTSFNRLGALRAAVSEHLDWDALAIPLVHGVSHDVAFASEERGTWVRFSTLQSINEERRLRITADFDDQREIAFFNSDGIRISVSSGQRTFLRFAIHFLSFASKGSLIIVDEPETHLHPNLVSAFSVLLYRVLRQTKSVAIVATHSPFIVREVPSHCVHIYSRLDDFEISYKKPYLRTLGASPTSLSLAIFGDDTSQKYYEKILNRINRSERLEDVISEYGAIISSDMLIQIRELLSTKSKSAAGDA